MTQTATQTEKRNTRAKVRGEVTSNKMHKTITVRVIYKRKHPKYGKYVNRISVYKAHDEKNEAKIGDEVEIQQTRPLSKTKNWRLLRITKSASVE